MLAPVTITSNVLVAVLLSILLTSCARQSSRSTDLPDEQYRVSSLVKTDMGAVIEVHVRESRSLFRELMIKLYHRNPRELARSTYAQTIEENVIRLFDLQHEWQFEEFPDKYGADLLMLSFSPDYQGDRVFSLMAGLLYMLMEAYDYRDSFYLFQVPDAQNLYNLARNIEIAIWKLSNDHDEHGELFLYSNSQPGEEVNLSFERLFGKIIGMQDTMALIISGRTNRTITKVIQQMATAVFLPIL